MIGNIGTGNSFLNCIKYCLEDKKELSEDTKKLLSAADHLQHKDRAEILAFNKCYGNSNELARDFNEVAKLSRRVEKPVFHISIRFAPGESLSKDKLIEITNEVAKEFGFADNQYISVLHKDTAQQHFHIVANRVGFDGKVAKDSNSYRRMAALCRRMEKRYGLHEVLSPRSFLAKGDRYILRNDKRKEQARADVSDVLKKAVSYDDFERQMNIRGYKVIKGRGICFIDSKKVKTKGSEIGYPLGKIEKLLSHLQQQSNSIGKTYSPIQQREIKPEFHQPYHNGVADLIGNILKPEFVNNELPYELLKEVRRKRKKKYNRGGGH
jgi:hypothetical protein